MFEPFGSKGLRWEHGQREKHCQARLCRVFVLAQAAPTENAKRTLLENWTFDEVMLDGELTWEGCARNSGVVKVIEKHLRGGRRAGTACAKRPCTSVCVFEADGCVHHV